MDASHLVEQRPPEVGILYAALSPSIVSDFDVLNREAVGIHESAPEIIQQLTLAYAT